MKISCLFNLLYLFIPFISFAQSKEMNVLLKEVKNASYYDSTKLFNAGKIAFAKAEETKNGKAIAEINLYYGNYFFYINNLNKARKYYTLALSDALKAGDVHFEILAQMRLGYMDYSNGNHIQIEKGFNELLDQSKELNDYEYVAEVLNLLGTIREEAGNLQEAIKYYLEGLNFAENHQLAYYPAVFKNNIGLVKLNTNQLKEALIDFKDGLRIAEKENNKRLISHIQMNICLGYVMENKWHLANQLFPKVIEYSKDNNLPQELGSNYANLGSAFAKNKKLTLAVAYYDSALFVLKKNNFKEQTIAATLAKISLLIQMNNVLEAEKILAEIKSLLLGFNNMITTSQVYFMDYEIKLSKKNYKGALDDYVKFSELQDSADKNFNSKIIEELQFNYKVQQKETELEKEKAKSILLMKSNQQEKLMKWISITSAFILLTLVIIVFYLGYARKIRKKQAQFSRKLIQNIEEERQRIAMDLHDDIGQSLSIIKSKLNKKHQQSVIEISSELESDLGKVIEQTREISRNLFPSNLAKIGLSRLIAVLMENIQSNTSLECSFEVTEDAQYLPLNIQTHIFRIIQECTNNTIKHSGATGLKISITEKNNDYTLLYQDNGKGIKIKTDNNGIGLNAIRERAKIIDGTIEIDEKAEKGFKLILRFKSVKKN